MRLKLLIDKYNKICERLAEIEMAGAADNFVNCYFNEEYIMLLIEKERMEEMEVENAA